MLGTEITALLDACPTAVAVFDLDEYVVFANAAARALWNEALAVAGCRIGDLIDEWPIEQDSCRLPSGTGGRPPAQRVRIAPCPGAAGLTAVFLLEAYYDATADKALQEANSRLRYVIEMLPQAMCVFDAKDRYVLWNRKYAELYADIADRLEPGMPFEEILKISLSRGGIKEVVSDEEGWLKHRMEKFRSPVSREEQRLHDGRWLRHDDQRTPDGGAIGIRVDITELKQREEWLVQLFDANPMPMLLCDADSLAILQANSAAVDFYGADLATLKSKKAFDMHMAGDAAEFEKRLRDLEGDCQAHTVWRQHDANGQKYHVLIYVRFLYEGQNRRLLLTVADVSRRVEAENQANRLAHHDPLTGLANRMQYYKALDDALCSDDGGMIVVYCLDLDGFKPVNDTFGHAAGDDVLKMVAVRLESEALGHMVARLGGDEFAILHTAATDFGVALADRCLAAFNAPFLIKGLPIGLGVSIGIAVAEPHKSNREGLMQAADRALYRAKAQGRNTWCMADDGRGADRVSVSK